MPRAKKGPKAVRAVLPPPPEPMPGVVRAPCAASTNPHDHPMGPEAVIDARRVLDRLPRFPWDARPDGVYDAAGGYVADFGFGQDAITRDAAKLPELLRAALDEVEFLDGAFAAVRDTAHNEVADEAREEGREEGFKDGAEAVRDEACNVFNDSDAEADGIVDSIREAWEELTAEGDDGKAVTPPEEFPARARALLEEALKRMREPLANARAGVQAINPSP